MLGDLMNMLGTNAPNQWEMTRSFALNVATGGSAEPNVEPIQRIRLEQLARVAELNVIEATGMPVSPDGRRLTCVPVGRGETATVSVDEHPRRDTTLEKLAALPSLTGPDGQVTAGNSSGIADGGAAVVVVDRDYADAHGMEVLATIRSWNSLIART